MNMLIVIIVDINAESSFINTEEQPK